NATGGSHMRIGSMCPPEVRSLGAKDGRRVAASHNSTAVNQGGQRRVTCSTRLHTRYRRIPQACIHRIEPPAAAPLPALNRQKGWFLRAISPVSGPPAAIRGDDQQFAQAIYGVSPAAGGRRSRAGSLSAVRPPPAAGTIH